jgi:hypothetical protein
VFIHPFSFQEETTARDLITERDKKKRQRRKIERPATGRGRG